MDFLYLGKKILFFSFALLTGLFITQAIIEAHSPEPGPDLTGVQALEEENSVIPEGPTLNERLRENLRDWIGENDTEKLPLDSDVIRQELTMHFKKGEPVAYVAMGPLYLVNQNGSVLSPADSMAHQDLPIITGDSIKIYASTMRLAGQDVTDALRFIRSVKRYYPSVYGNISEVHIDPAVGLIVMTNYSKGLPLIIGRGDMDEKIRNLNAFVNKLGQSELAAKARYLDFRLKGQIILKKAV